MHQTEPEISKVVDEGQSVGCGGEGQVPDVSVCREDIGSGGEVNSVQPGSPRQSPRSYPRKSLASIKRGRNGNIRQGIGTFDRAGYWGKPAIQSALGGVGKRTLETWRKELGLPIWDRRRTKRGPRVWWTDDSLLLVWKLKMCQLAHARRYSTPKRPRKDKM